MKKIIWGAVAVIAAAIIIYVITEFKPPSEETSPSSTIAMISVIIDDSETGDGNGQWNPGETIRLRFVVTNNGPSFVDANAATIEPLHEDVVVEVGEAPIASPPGLSPGDTVLVGDFIASSDSASSEAALPIKFSIFLDSELIFSRIVRVSQVPRLLVCIKKAEIEPTARGNELVIQLSLCINSLPDQWDAVAVEIPVSEIHRCGGSTLTFAALNDRVYFGDLLAGVVDCVSPDELCSAAILEFRYLVSGDMSAPSCIYFLVNVWQQAEQALGTCEIELLSPILPLGRWKCRHFAPIVVSQKDEGFDKAGNVNKDKPKRKK